VSFNLVILDGGMRPPVAPSMGQRSTSQLDYKRPTPSMTPRQKSYDDLKRHQVRTLPRDGRTRTPQKSSATSQRKNSLSS
jgi:hypothetical protein